MVDDSVRCRPLGACRRRRVGRKRTETVVLLLNQNGMLGAPEQRGPYTGSNMLNIKNSRLRSEHDVQLLRNRLERLRQEERKTLKKIEETRRRADQIIQLKTRNEQNHLRKQMMLQHMDQQQQRARERLLEQKLAGQNERQAIGEAKMMQRKRDAAMLREQRSLIEDHVRRENIEHVQRARELNAVRRA